MKKKLKLFLLICGIVLLLAICIGCVASNISFLVTGDYFHPYWLFAPVYTFRDHGYEVFNAWCEIICFPIICLIFVVWGIIFYRR